MSSPFSLQPLPIDPVLPDLVEALRQHGSVVLQAPTGAGKTTRVPPAVLDAGLAGQGRILLLEPRRLAARAAARRMASERAGQLGEEVGYQVRFDRKCTSRTRIIAITPGILLRMLQDDPFLESVGVLLFDEFHERNLESDLVLGIARLVQQTVRPDLKLAIMSATLDVGPLATYLGGAPVIVSEGRSYPVEVLYRPRAAHHPLAEVVSRSVEELLGRTDGDVLVFLPGLGEIRQCARVLEPLAEAQNLAVLPLHGELPAEQQDAALMPQSRRKVVLATNVAETSVTVEGITGVVDTGLARMLTFDPRVGLDRLQLTAIARSSADQRAGRAGRTSPGVCVRLWSERNHQARPEHTEPELHRVDLSGALLHLLVLGETDFRTFPWLEMPREENLARARQLLHLLGALEETEVTDLGRSLARLPVPPRLGVLLLEGWRWGQLEPVALAAALLSERDPFVRSLESTRPGTSTPTTQGPDTTSDVLERMDALEEFERTHRIQFPAGQLNRGTARFILRARDQLVRVVRQEARRAQWDVHQQGSPLGAGEAVQRALFRAFPDRLARRREVGSPRGVMVGGRGVRLAPSSGVRQGELFVCVDVDASQQAAAELLVRQASAVQRDWLPVEQMRTSTEVFFEEDTERVTARRCLCFDDLLIEQNPAALPDEQEVAEVLAQAARDHLERVLPAPDSTSGLYLLRVRCLRTWMPELNLPELTASELQDLLTWLCPGRRSFADLRDAPWAEVVRGQLTPQQQQAVEREAPERIRVPSGSHLALRYEEGRPPILAVRIQEVLGLQDTPRIAGGRVSVLLHLLAPNGRPQQVTDDLASFWKNTYPQVRKELRARYPKHAWPEDPLTALPERNPRRRREK